MSKRLLEVNDIHTYYGESHILQGVSLTVDDGQFVSLVGRNGAGKTTTLKSIMGISPPRDGDIKFQNQSIENEDPHTIASLGVGYAPSEEGIFPDLTVEENLQIGTFKGGSNGGIQEDVFSFFPVLEERLDQRGASLSGGEQRMLILARALIGDPKLLLIDEPFEGLQPSIVGDLVNILKEIHQNGTTILLVEQNIEKALSMSDYAFVLRNGQIVDDGLSDDVFNRIESHEGII